MRSRSKYRTIHHGVIGCVALALAASSAHAIAPDNPGSAAIQFSLNSGQNVKSISPWIYGSNSSSIVNRTMDRSGGNRMTGYNWENNASNAGSDWYHHSDYWSKQQSLQRPARLGGERHDRRGGDCRIARPWSRPHGRLRRRRRQRHRRRNGVRPIRRVGNRSKLSNRRSIAGNPVDPNSNVARSQQVRRLRLYRRVRQLGRLESRRRGRKSSYSLDNEPGLWGESLPPGWQSGVEPNPCCNPANGTNPSSGGRTHPSIHPFAPTFVEMRDKTIAHATAIKDVDPRAQRSSAASATAGTISRRCKTPRMPARISCPPIPAATNPAKCTSTSICSTKSAKKNNCKVAR